MDKRIALIIEDDDDIALLLEKPIAELGFEMRRASDGEQGVEFAKGLNPSLVLLDLLLPGIEGIEVCKQIRALDPSVPLILLTAVHDQFSKVLLLEIGADDYITKPFDELELKARIKAVLRRASSNNQPQSESLDVLKIGPIRVDFDMRVISKNDEEIFFTASEFDVLALLASKQGKPFTRHELYEAIYGSAQTGYDQSITTHIMRMRNKLEDDPANPKIILTVRGVGYKLAREEDL